MVIFWDVCSTLQLNNFLNTVQNGNCLLNSLVTHRPVHPKKSTGLFQKKMYLQSFVDNIASALHQNVDLSCAEPPINYAGTNKYDI
jgi:hypothetical protein